MTSKFTREELLNIIDTDHVQCGEASALARMALARMAPAAMDSSESVEMPLDYLQGHKDGLEWAAQLAEANHPETGDWLYDDPIELAKAIRKGPDMPPAQPAPVEVKGSDELYDVIDGDDNVVLSAVSYNEAQTESDGYNGEDLYIVRHKAQPALVVPDEYVAPVPTPTNLGYEAGWNACRAAMLAAAQQPQNAPQNIPEFIPDCWCLTCRPVVLNDMRFVVCPDCGNKRCPRANDHRNACTGSNEPGQEGSAYPAAPQEDINALIPLVSRNEREGK